MSITYFIQPCYYHAGQVYWTHKFPDADFFSVYSGEPWGKFQFISGHERPYEALQEIQRLLNATQALEVSADLATPFPVNPKLEEIGPVTD